MSPLSQSLDDSFKVTRLAEVVDEEQNLHDVFCPSRNTLRSARRLRRCSTKMASF
jgi:hypothetical protein